MSMEQANPGGPHGGMSLQEKEEQLRLAIDAAEVGLWDVDVLTGAMYWPARVKAMFGFSPNAATTLEDFVRGLHSDDRPLVIKAFADAQDPQLRTAYDVEYRTIGKEDGLERWVAAKGRGLFNDAGICTRAIGTAIDITRRKTNELLQTGIQNRLHLFDSIERAVSPLTDAIDVMQVTARLLGEHLKVTRCAYADVESDNDSFTIRSDWSRPGVPSSAGIYSLELFGTRATTDLRGGKHLVVHDVDRELGDAGGGRMFNAIGVKAIVCAGLVKGGRLVAMMAVHENEPRHWTEDELQIVGAVVDRCWAHIERVRDAALLREQDRHKDEFLATLAHELRNPIAPMLYSVAMLKRAADATQQNRARDVIERQVKHLARLIDDLLDVSRINRGVFELRREVVDIAPLLAQAVEASIPALERAHHCLRVELPTAPALVNVDPARLVQIVSNVLNNAAKYTPDGGDIRLSAKVHGSHVIVELADNGLGIPSEDQDRVFQMFTQLPHTGHITQGGLGVGLSLVKSLVEKHGGSVVLRSDGIGRGSRFTIELPLAMAHVPTETTVRPAGSTRRGRVLIVEDNVDGLATLMELVESEGHEVQGAADGPDALQMAARWRPDIILLDLGLPAMDGFEVAERLRGARELGDVRIVALTGRGAQCDRARTAAAGFDAHLTKPVDPDRLLTLLSEWVANRAV